MATTTATTMALVADFLSSLIHNNNEDDRSGGLTQLTPHEKSLDKDITVQEIDENAPIVVPALEQDAGKDDSNTPSQSGRSTPQSADSRNATPTLGFGLGSPSSASSAMSPLKRSKAPKVVKTKVVPSVGAAWQNMQ
jgi:hypothetical protein